MTTSIKTDLDFENNEIKNVRMDNRDTVPTAAKGGFYFNTKNNSFYFCDGTTFSPLLKLATDAEITAGTSTAKAVSVKQLADEIAKIISDVTLKGTPKAPTAATGTNTTQLATTAFVQQEIAAKTTVKIIAALNHALTVSNGKCEWTITHNLNSENLQVQIYETTSKTQVIADTQIVSATQIKITINSSANITAEKYKAVLMG